MGKGKGGERKGGREEREKEIGKKERERKGRGRGRERERRMGGARGSLPRPRRVVAGEVSSRVESAVDESADSVESTGTPTRLAPRFDLQRRVCCLSRVESSVVGSPSRRDERRVKAPRRVGSGRVDRSGRRAESSGPVAATYQGPPSSRVGPSRGRAEPSGRVAGR
jgi:hypothetical protein